MRAVTAMLVVSIALAGCNDAGGGDDPQPSASSSTSATATGAASLLLANLTADVVNGTAPLAVNFTLEATGAAASWVLTFGDGNRSEGNGTTLPQTLNHTYLVGGNFTATLTVEGAGNATSSANVTLTVAAPTGRPLPDVLSYSFGESLGCASDAHSLSDGEVPINCLSFQGGPDASGIDGHWLPLDERYWGLMMTTTMEEPTGANGDSDCYFFAPDATTEVGDGTNGGELCMGIVPEGTGWLFLYPYGTPATAMTADFALAPTA